MRQNKTSKKNRDSYIYYGADGKRVVKLKPSENGITEADIAMLHEMDDAEYNAQRRESYHIPVHLEAYTDGADDGAADRNGYLADYSSNPEEAFLASIAGAERKAAFAEIWNDLLPQQRELALKKLRGMSNTAIAAEEGVSEAAIRNRLKKIQEKFKNIRS